MRNTSIELDGRHKSYDGQPVLLGVSSGMRHARAARGRVADFRLILRDLGVSLVSVLWCRAAGGY